MLPDLEEVPESLIDESIFDSFLAWAKDKGITLYPAQEEAALGILAGDNVILATPTGSGKSMVAIAAHFIAMARGQRSFYTAPIKALVSEKFFALCDIFGPESVGMMTGDATVNSQAPIICATAEIVANMALRGGERAEIDQVIMDEFHYYSDPSRGWAWQVPLLEMPNTQFLLMSATLGNTSMLQEDLTRRTGRVTSLVGADADRPVPLDFEFVYTPIHETIERLLKEDKAPVYVVHFTQREAVERAQSLTSLKIIDKETKEKIAEEIGADVRISKTAALLHDVGKAVTHRIEGKHHHIGAALARKYGMDERIAHAIEAHHDDIEATTPEAIIVRVCDAMSGARPGARNVSSENFAERMKDLENIATSFDGIDKAYAISAGREIRVMVSPEKIDDLSSVKLARDIANKIESTMQYPGTIKVNVIRETRAIEYAK